MASAKMDITLNHGYTENSGSLTYLSIASGALVFLMLTIITAV